MKNLEYVAAAAAVSLLVLVGGACSSSSAPTKTKETRETEPVKTASPEELQRWKQTAPGHIGVIVARDSVDVASKVDGTVETLLVRLGESVKKGQPIARISDEQIRRDLRKAIANLDRANASVKAAGREAGRLSRRAKTSRRLGSDVVAKEVAADERSAAGAAYSRRDEAKAIAVVEQIKVEDLESMLDQTTIVAPWDGKIAKRYADPGVLVSRGTPVVRLIASDELWVRFAVPIEAKSRYVVGDDIKVKLEASDIEVIAKIRQMSPDVDPTLQMIEGEAELLLDADQAKIVQAGMATWVNPATPKEPVVQKN